MFGKEKSPEFIQQALIDKTGVNNPMFGKKHSVQTLAKISKQVFVYDVTTKELIKVYSGVVEAKTDLKIGYDTLKKYCESHKPYKGMIFSMVLL